MPVGTYTLIAERTESGNIDVGALGETSFPEGWYAYSGTAFGPGGFGRVDRHREIASGERDTRHWHVDYLLGDRETRLDDVVTTVDVDAECAISERLDGERVPDFGCSDCRCGSHLVYHEVRDPLVTSVERAHREA